MFCIIFTMSLFCFWKANIAPENHLSCQKKIGLMLHTLFPLIISSIDLGFHMSTFLLKLFQCIMSSFSYTKFSIAWRRVKDSVKFSCEDIKIWRFCITKYMRISALICILATSRKPEGTSSNIDNLRCQIHDLWRRGFRLGTRDQAWSLKSFCAAEFY